MRSSKDMLGNGLVHVRLPPAAELSKRVERGRHGRHVLHRLGLA